MSWDNEAYGPHGRNHGQADLRAVTQSASGGLFEGNVFQGRRGMGNNGDSEATRQEIPLAGDVVDGDLAVVLWHMGLIDASMVQPGSSPVIAGFRALARRLSLQPATAVSQAGRTATVDSRIYSAIQAGSAAVEALDATQRTALLARLDSERTRQGAPTMPAAEKEALLIRSGGGTLLPPAGSTGGAPRWLPWALIGGGVLVAGGIVWVATRKPARVTANKRRRRRRRRRTTR